MAHLGNRVRALRKSLGYTLEQFAEKISITGGGLSNIELSGKASEKIIRAICACFLVSEEWLVHGTGSAPQGVVVRADKPIDNPWENALVKELKEEVDFLRGVVKSLTANGTKANFLKALTNKAGVTGRLVEMYPTDNNKPGAQVGARA